MAAAIDLAKTVTFCLGRSDEITWKAPVLPALFAERGCAMAGTLLPSELGFSRSLFGNSPFSMLRHEMDNLLSRFSGADGDWASFSNMPPVDVSETEGNLQVRVDLPGIKPEEVHLEVLDNVLTLRGERKDEKEEKGKSFHRVERRFGSFARSIRLPCAVVANRVEALCKDGVLTITLPQSEESKAQRIKVKS